MGLSNSLKLMGAQAKIDLRPVKMILFKLCIFELLFTNIFFHISGGIFLGGPGQSDAPVL